MGATFAPSGSSVTVPHFVVNALKDHADLAEVDIIKGWYVGGTLKEQVVRFTPTTPGALWNGGSACIRWRDDGFAPGGPAFYYARVLEVPTRAGRHYDCRAPTTAGCEPGGTLDVNIQERASTSPIWWQP